MLRGGALRDRATAAALLGHYVSSPDPGVPALSADVGVSDDVRVEDRLWRNAAGIEI